MSISDLDVFTANAVADELSELANRMEWLADRQLLLQRIADYRDHAKRRSEANERNLRAVIRADHARNFGIGESDG